MKTIRTHCLCLCHTRLHGLSSDGTVQPCAIKQLFPVHQLRLVTLDENIFAWFPWLQRGERWLPSQPSGSPFIHTHIIYFCRFLEGPSCTEWKCKKRPCVDSRGFEPFVIASPAGSPWQPGMEILKNYFCSFSFFLVLIFHHLTTQSSEQVGAWHKIPFLIQMNDIYSIWETLRGLQRSEILDHWNIRRFDCTGQRMLLYRSQHHITTIPCFHL